MFLGELDSEREEEAVSGGVPSAPAARSCSIEQGRRQLLG